MQISKLEYRLEDSILTQRVLHLRVGASDVSSCMDRVASKLKKDAVVPGFRKGRGPLPVVRKHLKVRIEAEAFDELRRAALDQVIKQLKEEDRPFLPPEVVARGKVQLRYAQELLFAVKYLVDPSGMGKKPEQPGMAENPMVQHPSQATGLPMGVPASPKLPTAPSVRSAPRLSESPG